MIKTIKKFLCSSLAIAITFSMSIPILAQEQTEYIELNKEIIIDFDEKFEEKIETKTTSEIKNNDTSEVLLGKTEIFYESNNEFSNNINPKLRSQITRYFNLNPITLYAGNSYATCYISGEALVDQYNDKLYGFRNINDYWSTSSSIMELGNRRIYVNYISSTRAQITITCYIRTSSNQYYYPSAITYAPY